MQHRRHTGGTGCFSKAAIIITVAAAMGAWAAFSPLVSRAQEAKEPQKKEAPAPQQQKPAGDKTIQLSDAQLKTAAGVVNRDSANIWLRLRQYSDTVAAIDRAVPHGLTHIGYALKLCEVINAKHSSLLLSRFMHNLLGGGSAECYNKAMLGFDAARRRGIPAAIAFGRTSEDEHALLKLWDIYIDMNNGCIYERKEHRFVSSYFETSSEEVAAYVAYEHLSAILRDRGDFSGAIAMFGKAIALAPRAADAYLARGTFYYLKYCNSLALADFYSALEIDNGNPTALFYINEIKKQKK